MKQVFADTVYWIAITRKDDSWHEAALNARQTLGPALIVTTDEVLAEFLTAFSKSGEVLRRRAAKTARAVMASVDVKVLPQSRNTFEGGLARYESRGDKQYSLQDCVSMNAMEQEGINGVLTIDHHFEQEGFEVLMRR